MYFVWTNERPTSMQAETKIGESYKYLRHQEVDVDIYRFFYAVGWIMLAIIGFKLQLTTPIEGRKTRVEE